MKTKVYTIGSFSGWRDKIGEKLSDKYEFDDPRNHSQSSIARLVNDDMGSAINCPVSLIYTPKGKRAGTMSYAELGASWARGNTIISVDENIVEDDLIKEVATIGVKTFDGAAYFLNNQKCYGGNGVLEVKDRTESREPYNGVLFAGDYKFQDTTGKLLDKRKSFFINPKPNDFEPTTGRADLIVANFEKGHDPRGLFYMGVGYALKMPVIMLEGNSVPYPPLLGLARRVMIGEDRHAQLDYYLENLESQHISDEAMVYYDLMKKFE